MKETVRFMLLTLLVVMIGASLCFGQVAPRPKKERTPPPADTAPPPAPQPQVAAPAAADTMKFKPGLQFYTKKDGLQCILDHASQLGAAYAEAEGSGCKKVMVGQATVYNCGYSPGYPGYPKCQAAKEKIENILKNCGLTPPVHNPATGGWDMNPVTPGCNSLGINCMVDPT